MHLAFNNHAKVNSARFDALSRLAEKNNRIDPDLYHKYDVKRGLRNNNGTGVLVGLTGVGDVHGYRMDNGVKVPDEGKLYYRGIEIKEIIEGFQKDGRYGFEEVNYLLLFGVLPNRHELEEFVNILGENRKLPDGFTEDMMLKVPSRDIMNMLARSVLAAYCYDRDPDDLSLKSVLRHSIELIARFPTMAVYGYQAKSRYYDNKSLFIHTPREELSTAENILYMLRPTCEYSRLEAELLDLALVLHAEHGGGNNSTFTTRVVTSTGTDTYSAIAAAVGSLKGGKHGGANLKVLEMMENIKANVRDWDNEDKLKAYLHDIVNKKANDGSGLIYGMGHAVYTLSDPRAVLLKKKAAELAKEKGAEKEFHLYSEVERLTSVVFSEVRNEKVTLAANVDLYSGFVYKALNIPRELYTPLFAIARIGGWCAHRIEELASGGKIIRPAYKNVAEIKRYVPLSER
ncbi:MAG: citrate/2-methylcitrate synthase [Peptococcaceae bacterium]|nr:citrate/2-methylcitrate synthase [Peptococcaceae bacterium]MDH7525731.1 citrate/2-methylcitrate synthase [Peptococcaceae bacterium]